MKQDFLTKSFSPPTLLTVEYSSGYLLFTSYSTMIEIVCINSWKSIWEKLHHCQGPKTWWTWGVISIIGTNKLHALHKTHLHTMKVYNIRPVSGLTIKVFTKVFTCAKVINAWRWQNLWTDPFWKGSTSFTSIFPKLSSQNKAWRCDTSWFLFLVSTVFARNAWDHDSLLASTQTHTHTHTQKKCLHFLSLAVKITTTCSWPGSRNQYGMSVTEAQMSFLQSVPSRAEQETSLYFQVTIRVSFRSF